MSIGKNICKIVYRKYPRVLPSQEEPHVPLSAEEVAYEAVVDATVDSILNPFL